MRSNINSWRQEESRCTVSWVPNTQVIILLLDRHITSNKNLVYALLNVPVYVFVGCSAGVQACVLRGCVLHLDVTNRTVRVGLPAVFHSYHLVKTNNGTSDEEIGHTTYRCFNTTGNTNKLIPVYFWDRKPMMGSLQTWTGMSILIKSGDSELTLLRYAIERGLLNDSEGEQHLMGCCSLPFGERHLSWVGGCGQKYTLLVCNGPALVWSARQSIKASLNQWSDKLNLCEWAV